MGTWEPGFLDLGGGTWRPRLLGLEVRGHQGPRLLGSHVGDGRWAGPLASKKSWLSWATSLHQIDDPVPNSLPYSRDSILYLCPFKSTRLSPGSQGPQGGGQVRHLLRPWDPTSRCPAQSHSATFTQLRDQLCSPAVILDPTEQVRDPRPQVTLS